jgi:predicted transposase YbfD/YdcC
VSAWLCDEGLVLGQRKTEEKSNEITAVPELLRVLDIRGATVTIDATLRRDIEETFAQAADARQRSCDELARPAVEVFEESDKGHGRVEKRTVKLCRDLSVLTTADSWMALAFVAQVTRERSVLATGKTSTETAYYIGSEHQATAESAGHTIRRHYDPQARGLGPPIPP